MQLILDSEPTLDVKRDMSAIDEIHTEKVGNGDIQQVSEINCNGNKENIDEVNVITNEDKNKLINNAEIDVLQNSPLGGSENFEEEEKEESIVGDAIAEKTCDLSSSKTNGALTELSNNNGVDEENQQQSTITTEEEKTAETEEAVEDEEDIIRIKQENYDDIPDITENETEIDISENDKTKIKEDLSDIKDDLEVCHSTPAIKKEPIPDVELKEPESTIENKDKDSEPSENKDKQLDESKVEVVTSECESTQLKSTKDVSDPSPIEAKDDMDVEEVVDTTKSSEQDTDSQAKEKPTAPVSNIIDKPILCKLSNTLDILSDDEEEPSKEEPPKVVDSNEKQCINIEDDDDIMLIDEDSSKIETSQPVHISNKEDTPIKADDKHDSETGDKTVDDTSDLFAKADEKDSTHSEEIKDNSLKIDISEKKECKEVENISSELPLVPENFLKSAKKNLADMTREDLEEFCILKIVESIVDRSNLSEIKNKLKSVAQGVDEYRKKAMMLTKQNRDLQVVLKSIQEEQKKIAPGIPITPLKITRSVGMQVFMEKSGARRKNLAQLQNSNTNNSNNRQNAKSLPATNVRQQKPPGNQPIPVPRLVPANSPAMKSPSAIPIVNQITPGKTTTPLPNGIKNSSPQKAAEKRHHNRTLSVTVDLTDDEPPTKLNNRTSPAPPVRLIPPQNLMANNRQSFPTTVSNPRKVYIPISGPQSQNIRPGQTIMLKSVPTPGLRPRCPTPQVSRMPAGSVRMNRTQAGRHPAPLPESMKQYQPPNWKALPPAPDLKLSKVENGIVISWKIEGYQEDSYEEIASYQLYAYQETSSPPSTSLWKKIGDVKALPLPMACTLTQFMAGFKYFFAVRAVDIRSRLGPFSLPGSILLLNKL